MEVRKVEVGYLHTNCYIIVEDGKCLVVDPGDQFYSIEDQIDKNKLVGILITHYHDDHIGALEKLVKAYNVEVYDRNSLKEGENNIDIFNFEVLYTPGHTSDSITFIFKKYSFMLTGDFIFKNSIGRTDLLTGNMDDMRRSLNKIKEYSDRYRVYPGHGEATTLGEEKSNNPFFNM